MMETAIEHLHSCFKCGQEFRGRAGKRICPFCVTQKPTEKPILLGRSLSVREKQVVALVCKAKLNKEIADELHLTEGTVKEYLNRIFRKVGATNRTELAIFTLTTRLPNQSPQVQ